MKNYAPIYFILATMAVAAVAIGAEPARHNNKQLELSKSEAGKQAGGVVFEAADAGLPKQRFILIQSKDLDDELSVRIAAAIATARARKRTG